VDLPARTLTVCRQPTARGFAEQRTIDAAALGDLEPARLPGVPAPLAGLFDTPEEP